jgi:hypothetical protein
MRYEEVRDQLLAQWRYTGGPNEAKASELYHDDALLEFPQSGERFRGKASIQGWRERYPARLDFEPREIRGAGDLWVADPFPAPEWRRPWADDGPPRAPSRRPPGLDPRGQLTSCPGSADRGQAGRFRRAAGG